MKTQDIYVGLDSDGHFFSCVVEDRKALRHCLQFKIEDGDVWANNREICEAFDFENATQEDLDEFFEETDFMGRARFEVVTLNIAGG